MRRTEFWLTSLGLLLLVGDSLLSATPAVLAVAAALVALPAALGHALDSERSDPTERTFGERLIIDQWVKSASDDTADLERMLEAHYRRDDDLSPAERALRQHIHTAYTDSPGTIMVMPPGETVMRPGGRATRRR
jgi:hypothetical protein